MQNDLDILMQWTHDWPMTFNIEKCKIMYIGNRNFPKLCYYINGKKLEECSSVRYPAMGADHPLPAECHDDQKQLEDAEFGRAPWKD